MLDFGNQKYLQNSSLTIQHSYLPILQAQNTEFFVNEQSEKLNTPLKLFKLFRYG
jgi:hypothetical protein